MASAVSIQWAYSNKRQSAYATKSPNADLTLSAPFEGIDIADHVPNMSDNAGQFGKGHEWATRNEILSWDLRFKRSFQATTSMLGWAFAFHLGNVSTVANGGGAFTHTMEWQDMNGAGYYGSGRQQPCATIAESVSASLVRCFPSCQVMAVEVTGQMNDWIKLSVEIIGSGKKLEEAPTSYTITMPTSTEGSLLRNAALYFELGPTGVYSDYSCDVRSFRFRSEVAYFEDDGYCPGSGYNVSGDPTSGQIRSRLEIDKRAVTLEFVIRAGSSNALFDYLENSIQMNSRLTVTGSLIASTFYHKLLINIPKLKFRAVPIGTDGNLITYQVQTVVFYDATLDNPFDVTIVNTDSAYLTSS